MLLLLGAPFLSARFENGDARTLPRSSEVRAAALTLADRFPARGTDPITVIADGRAPTIPRSSSGSIRPRRRPGVLGSLDPARHPCRPDRRRPRARRARPREPRRQRSSSALRADRPSFDIEVGGAGGRAASTSRTGSPSRLPIAAALVCLATLVLLFLMTGSLIVPIKAVIMNILSLGASFGALAWIFQDGHLSGPLGFDSVGALDLWMPVLILIFAFGLSMDYEVFLLSRIKEVHDQTGDNDLAVAVGLQRSRPDHHLRRGPDRGRLRRLRRRRGARHQTARRRARHRRHRRCHARAHPARARRR